MKRFLVALLLCACLVAPASADIQYKIRKAKKGKKLRDFNPPESLLSFSNPALTARELQGAKLAPGHREWAGFQLSNPLSKNPPLFLPADVGTQSIMLTATQVDATGKSTPLYTIILDGATIIEDEKGTSSAVEKVQITFQKIEWTWTDGGTPFNDTWLPLG